MIGLNLVILLVIFALLFSLQLFFNKSFFLKIIVLTYLFIISSGIYFSLNTYKGWPSNQKVDSGFVIISLVLEPTKNTTGRIFVWVLPDEKEIENNWLKKIITYTPSDSMTPRVFEYPYSEKAASEFNKANEAIKEGNYVHIDGDGVIDGDGDGEGNGNTSDGEIGNRKDGGMLDSRKYDVPHLTIISPEQMNRK